MFFTECERLAEQHPNLAGVFEKLDSQLKAMGTAEVLRSEDLASFLRIEPNQMRSALDLVARAGVLRRMEMIECSYCQMAALHSDYQEALDDDGEYRCTSCDRELTARTIRFITTYENGEKWRTFAKSTDGSGDPSRGDLAPGGTPANTVPDEQAFYSHGRLAAIFNVGEEALRKRLDRYRKRNMNGWKPNEDRRTREPKYLYQLQAVRTIVEELRSSGQRPAK